MLAAIGIRRSAAANAPVGECRVIHNWRPASGDVMLASEHGTADILVDPDDYPVVHIAANMLAGDLLRVTGHKPAVTHIAGKHRTAIIIGTLGHCRWIDALAGNGTLQTHVIRGKWESFVWQVVEQPVSGIDRAVIIAGSDRRGTAYGVMELIEAAGVSPWHWWADVAVNTSRTVALSRGVRISGEPGVKYRGIFINDEDWGFEPWAAHTLDPRRGNIGPKTYQKVFDLMLRLKLNYLWPAMHTCSTPFAAIPENAALADDYAIVMGASHVEPMLANPATFLQGPGRARNGPWNFVTNSARILKFWKQSVISRGRYEAVWTIGMRGPYDSPLLGVHTLKQERTLVEKIFHIQDEMLKRFVTRRWGRPAECYVPYKEALLVFNSRLQVPPDATIVWPDNNFGYIRQLGTAEQRRRPGGAGVYYHAEYLGVPHSYCWLNTTPPALMWEELKKAWDNQARTIWVINVGGIKPREIAVDFAARMAWNPTVQGPDAQPRFLTSFAESTCGIPPARAIADMMHEYFLLGQIRRPESMNRDWAAELPLQQVTDLMGRYKTLLAAQRQLGRTIPVEKRAAFFELFAYSVQMLSATGLLFLYDRQIRPGNADAARAQREVAKWRRFIERQVAYYNNRLSGGKWRNFATMGGSTWRTNWASTQWPWVDHHVAPLRPAPAPLASISADNYRSNRSAGRASWRRVAGLGRNGGAMALWPAVPENHWILPADAGRAPCLEYEITTASSIANGLVILHVLPTYELHPGMQLRVAMSWNRGPVHILEVPYASSETRVAGNRIRSLGVLNNQLLLRQAVGGISAGRQHMAIYAVDPGLVLDEISISAAL